MLTIEGYSGCGITVHRANNDYVVEKNTDNPIYVPRLLLQRDKQMRAYQRSKKAEGDTSRIIIPKVLYTRLVTETDGENKEQGKTLACRIGMPFVHHTDTITFLSRASIESIKSLSTLLMDVLEQQLSWCDIGEGPDGCSCVPISVFTDKLFSISTILKENKYFRIMAENFKGPPVHPLLFIEEKVIPNLVKYFTLYSEIDGVKVNGESAIWMPLGSCHGDFTLSNILIIDRSKSLLTPRICDPHHSGQSLCIALIDFLDSFVETPLVDMAKLCQDLKYGWTLRLLMYPSHRNSSHQLAEKCINEKTLQRRLLLRGSTQADALNQAAQTVFIAMNHIFQDMENHFKHRFWYKRYLCPFLLMNQLRVLQYSKNEEVASYLYQTIAREYNDLASLLDKL